LIAFEIQSEVTYLLLRLTLNVNLLNFDAGESVSLMKQGLSIMYPIMNYSLGKQVKPII